MTECNHEHHSNHSPSTDTVPVIKCVHFGDWILEWTNNGEYTNQTIVLHRWPNYDYSGDGFEVIYAPLSIDKWSQSRAEASWELGQERLLQVAGE